MEHPYKCIFDYILLTRYNDRVPHNPRLPEIVRSYPFIYDLRRVSPEHNYRSWLLGSPGVPNIIAWASWKSIFFDKSVVSSPLSPNVETHGIFYFKGKCLCIIRILTRCWWVVLWRRLFWSMMLLKAMGEGVVYSLYLPYPRSLVPRIAIV